MKNLSYLFVLLFCLSFLTQCGGKKEKELSEKGELLISQTWKLQPNESLKSNTDSIEGETGIKADIKLEGDVGKFANFVAESLVFGRDSKDKSKLSYSSQVGEGMLSLKTLGYWDLEGDKLTMREWDNEKSQEKEPVHYTIVELTKEKLVLKNTASGSTKIYFPKK